MKGSNIMTTALNRLVATFAVALSVAGCALTEDTVSLKYSAMPGVVPLPTAQLVQVDVVASDARVDHQDRVSVKKNGYGMEMAAIRSDRDIVALVKESIDTELSARGFKAASGAGHVKVEVMKFYCDFKVGFFTGDAVAEVLFNVQVVGPNNAILYSKPVSSTGKNADIMMASGSNAKVALENGLQVAVANLMNDPEFISAVFKSAGKAAPGDKPVS